MTKRQIKEGEVLRIYEYLKKTNNALSLDNEFGTILDFMRDCALDKIKEIEVKNKPRFLTVIIDEDLIDDRDGFWYNHFLGEHFNVQMISFRGQMNDIEGFGRYEPEDCYFVMEGEFEGNLILKKHCRIVSTN